MNVYDSAHNLAAAIRNSDEYKQYMAVKEQTNQNSELSAMLADFQAKQMEAQMKQMMGEQVDGEFMGQIQSLSSIMMRDPLAMQYLQCEMRFSLMMNDVYQILGELMGIKLPKAE